MTSKVNLDLREAKMKILNCNIRQNNIFFQQWSLNHCANFSIWAWGHFFQQLFFWPIAQYLRKWPLTSEVNFVYLFHLYFISHSFASENPQNLIWENSRISFVNINRKHYVHCQIVKEASEKYKKDNDRMLHNKEIWINFFLTKFLV